MTPQISILILSSLLSLSTVLNLSYRKKLRLFSDALVDMRREIIFLHMNKLESELVEIQEEAEE
jgi:hypothetical protein